MPLQAPASSLWDKEEVELAIERIKIQIKKDAIGIDDKGHLVRLEDVMELMERAFGT